MDEEGIAEVLREHEETRREWLRAAVPVTDADSFDAARLAHGDCGPGRSFFRLYTH